MTTNHDRRLTALERVAKPPCRTCYGYAFAIVFVPDGDDETAPEWNPTQCRECGIPLRTVQKIIGISEEEMYGADVLGR